MKITLEFDDRHEATCAFKGAELYSALFAIRETVIRDRKDGVEPYVTLDKVAEIASDVLEVL